MTSDTLLYIGAIVITGWGIAHSPPTRAIVRGFGDISEDNRRILTMEWIMEGLTLCFIGMLVLLVTLIAGSQAPATTIVYQAAGFMLIAMALVSIKTGARTGIVPMRICPIIFTTVASLFFLGSIL